MRLFQADKHLQAGNLGMSHDGDILSSIAFFFNMVGDVSQSWLTTLMNQI